MSASLISPADSWPIWAVIAAGVAACIWAEQRWAWAAKLTGPLLMLIAGMTASNARLMPAESPAYEVVDTWFVPVAIPLLLFRANVRQIIRQSGTMFVGFHLAALGTVAGAFVATWLFGGAFPRAAEVAGVMTGSYTGGAVNFVALQNSFALEPALANPLIVADNFIMGALFAVLFLISASRFFLARYPHPHTPLAGAIAHHLPAADHWRRKEIGLLDLALALGVAVTVAAVSFQVAALLKARLSSDLLRAILANPFVWITVGTTALGTGGHRWMARINGAEELGMYLLYLFFFVIGLRADLWQVVLHVPVLFAFCLVMALTNLVVTLGLGRWLRLNLEELLLSVNATLGGAPSAAAMAVARGWSPLVLPALLAGLWGYVIGTFVGLLTTELIRRVL